MKRCLLHRLGLVEYGKAWNLQRDLFSERLSNKIDDTLLLLQHPPTYTFGRSGRINQSVINENEFKGFDIYYADRGGGATYHGYGQLVGYPIIGIKSYTSDFHEYLRMLEEVIIKTLSDFDIDSIRIKGLTGVWVNEKKIGCIGVRIIRNVTMHGFSLNVNNDLAPFERIVPCGIKGVKMTSMAELLGSELILEYVEEVLVNKFSEVFNVTVGI